MQVVEQHRIDRHDPRFAAIDAATLASKNLYNAVLYLYLNRQAYIFEHHRVISYNDLDKLMQEAAEYRALPAKVAQWVLKHVCAAWESSFAAVAEWNIHPEQFTGHPKLPKYLAKDGCTLLVFTTDTPPGLSASRVLRRRMRHPATAPLTPEGGAPADFASCVLVPTARRWSAVWWSRCRLIPQRGQLGPRTDTPVQTTWRRVGPA